MIRDEGGVANAALESLGIDRDLVRATVLRTIKKGKVAVPSTENLTYTSKAKKALEYAMTEARELGHSYVSAEHLLLGLLREEKGIAAEVLTDCGLTLDAARAEILRLLGTELPTWARQAEAANRQHVRVISVTVHVEEEGAGQSELHFTKSSEAIKFLLAFPQGSSGH